MDARPTSEGASQDRHDNPHPARAGCMASSICERLWIQGHLGASHKEWQRPIPATWILRATAKSFYLGNWYDREGRENSIWSRGLRNRKKSPRSERMADL